MGSGHKGHGHGHGGGRGRGSDGGKGRGRDERGREHDLGRGGARASHPGAAFGIPEGATGEAVVDAVTITAASLRPTPRPRCRSREYVNTTHRG